MTRVPVNSTARRGYRRVAWPLIGGFLALFVAGCESSTTSSTSSAPSAALTPQVQTKPVAFAPVIGAPAKVSAKFNELLAASAGQKNMPVVAPKDAEYTVRGYLVAASDPKGTKLSYMWDVSDRANKRKRMQGEELIEGKKGGDPWALVDEAAMQRVAAKAVDEIAAYIPKGAPVSPDAAAAPAPGAASAPTASASPVVPASLAGDGEAASSAGGTVLAAQTPAPGAEAVAVVEPVTGAPGDGQDSLTAAMRRHLQQAGVKVGSGGGSNAYTVRGTVEMGSAVDGQQPITIQWMVVDPSGKALDKAVVQRNKVAQGSLDGQWGQVADLAAGEAAKSIAKLIGRPTG